MSEVQENEGKIHDLPSLIIINGLPCTGKTTLGRKIEKELNLPFVTKDGIKETLFDSMGWSDRDWSRKLSQAAYDLIFHLLEPLLTNGINLVVESNFRSGPHRQRFLELQKKIPFFPIEILCFADGAILLERFKARAAAGLRHPGHVDAQTFNELKSELLTGKSSVLNLGGPLIEIDTTYHLNISFNKIIQQIRACRLEVK